MIGDHLSLDDYIADFDERFEAPADDCWKVERRQTFVEQGSASYDAFARGDWSEALRLIEERKPGLREYHEQLAARGLDVRRVRVVEQPVSPYLVWELNSLRQRRELGELIRVAGGDLVAPHEVDGELPEVVGIDEAVVYQVLYDDEGVATGAIRSTDPNQVAHWRGVFVALFDRSEDLADFFDREVTGLRPPGTS